MTQDELGLRSGIHPTWISRIESGRINPTFGSVARLADGLGVGLTELVARTESILDQEKESKALEAEIRWRRAKPTDGIDQG